MGQAVEQLRQAAHLMPTSPFVLSTLGEAYHRIGKLQEAQNTLKSALMIDPSLLNRRLQAGLGVDRNIKTMFGAMIL